MIAWLRRPRVFVDEVGPAEAETLAEIHAEAFPHAWAGEDFAALMAGANVFALGIRREPLFGRRRLLGFILVRFAADEAEILTVAMQRTSRGRGYGRRLVEEALRRLYREGVAACFLEVDRGNMIAVRLYRALGFAEVGIRERYYEAAADREGSALVMRFQLR